MSQHSAQEKQSANQFPRVGGRSPVQLLIGDIMDGFLPDCSERRRKTMDTQDFRAEGGEEVAWLLHSTCKDLYLAL